MITMGQLKIAAVLIVAASLGANAWMATRVVRAELACQKRMSEARLEAVIAAKDTTISIGAEIAADRAKERDELLADLRGITARGERDRESYVRVMELLKVLEPSCGPGQARVDAYNDTMRSAP
jgi:hypothetical protein